LATPTGFGKPKAQPKAKSNDRRAAAANQLDEMRSKGMPEFEVYVRVKDQKPWYPVGALAVNRSNQLTRPSLPMKMTCAKGRSGFFRA
jgi:hypothetical protein